MSNEYFDAKALEWDDSPMRQQLSRALWQFIEYCGVLNKDMSVLDYGCGTGLMSMRLSRKVKTVYAADISTGMLGRLCDKIDDSEINNIRVIRYNMMLDTPLNICPDIIISAMALHHIQDVEDVVEKMAAMIAPGGNIILADLCAEDGTFHSTIQIPHNGFEPAYIEDLLMGNGMEITKSQVVFEINKNDKNYPVFGISAKKS
jgi:2-polyprenyl-3-methyl-5-hydroxy-6-metoxy-1,4-benzoquinol methylase